MGWIWRQWCVKVLEMLPNSCFYLFTVGSVMLKFLSGLPYSNAIYRLTINYYYWRQGKKTSRKQGSALNTILKEITHWRVALSFPSEKWGCKDSGGRVCCECMDWIPNQRATIYMPHSWEMTAVWPHSSTLRKKFQFRITDGYIRLIGWICYEYTAITEIFQSQNKELLRDNSL